MDIIMDMMCRSQLPRASVRRPRTLRVVQQSRGLYHTTGRPHSCRDGSKPSPGLALDSNHCNPLARLYAHRLNTSISEGTLTHAVSLLSQRQSGFLPLLKVLSRVDSATDMALRPHAPVLGESRRANDGRLVDSPFAPDLVGAAVALEGTVARVVAIIGRVVLVAEVLDDIIFDERVCGPTVEA